MMQDPSKESAFAGADAIRRFIRVTQNPSSPARESGRGFPLACAEDLVAVWSHSKGGAAG
jgi:hypothetical protein